MNTPRVTAIIPAYNAAPYLRFALESVLRQSYGGWEAVVVDDGSTDSTRAVVESYVPVFGERLRYVYQANRGLPAARNAAMWHARGEIFALLDADDVWLPNRLEKTVAALDDDPSVGLVHAGIARIDVAGNVIDIPPRPPLKYLSGRIAREIYTRKAHIHCATATFRRACLDRSGDFDEAMRATEDRDMWFRIAEYFSVRYVNVIVSHYRISPNSMSSDPERMWRAQTYFLNKHLNRGAVSADTYREALASLWRERGDVYFHRDALREVVRCYGKAVGTYPLDFRNWYALIRALGDPLVQGLQLLELRQAIVGTRTGTHDGRTQ